MPSMDLTKLNDGELEELHKMQSGGKADLSKFTDHTLAQLYNNVQEQEAPPKTGRELETGAKSAINEATLGYYPQIVGGLKSAFTDKQYIVARDEASKDLADLKAENPKSAMAGQVAGIVASSAIPMGVAAKGAGLLSKVARGSIAGATFAGLSNPGDEEGVLDPIQKEARLSNAKVGASIGAAIPVVGSAIGKVATKVSDSKFGQKSLQELSDNAAIKQAGAMLKQFRKIFGNDKAGEIADTLKNETVHYIDANGKQNAFKILELGDSVDDIAFKAEKLKENVGSKIGQIYQKIDDAITNPDFIMSSDGSYKLANAQRFNPVTDKDEIMKMIVDKYGKKVGGKEVMSKAQSVLSTFEKRSNSLTDSLALKGEIDELVNYSKATQDLPAVQHAFIDIRNFIRDKTNKYVESAGEALGIGEAKALPALNKKFGNAAEITQMAEDMVARVNANQAFGLTDKIAGAGGLGAGAVIGGGPAALAAGGAAMVANKLVRKYGMGILTKGAQAGADVAGSLSNITNRTSQALSPIAKPLIQAASNPITQGVAAGAVSRRFGELQRQQEQRILNNRLRNKQGVSPGL